MDAETTETVRRLQERLDEAELGLQIVAHALRGALSQMNPNAQVAARRMANTAVLAYCPEGQRPRRLELLLKLFPNARDRSGDVDFTPPGSGL